MNAFENAQKFFHNCESAKGWKSCADFVVGDGKFLAQSEPLMEVKDIKSYVEWVEGLSNVTMPGSRYDLHAAAYDAANNTAIFFSSFIGTHSGDGGPVSPTGKTTNTDYVYAINMNDEGKIVSMTKIWNASWALRELGWMG